jgi:hypothetical protein
MLQPNERASSMTASGLGCAKTRQQGPEPASIAVQRSSTLRQYFSDFVCNAT